MLCSKYRRALEIKATHNALLDAMRDLGVESREVFETWLEKEKAHLRTLSKEPVEETLEMEYYQKLVNMREAECVPFPSFAHAVFNVFTETASR